MDRTLAAVGRKASHKNEALRIHRQKGADILAILKFRNLRLHNALAGRTFKEISAETGICAEIIGRYLSLRVSAINKKTHAYKKSAVRLAECLCMPIAELFSPQLCELADLLPGQLEAEQSSEQMLPLMSSISLPDPGNLELGIDEERLKGSISDLVGTLSKREQLVIRRRFGLDDGDDQTLEQVGLLLGVQRETVRQIESRALRHLRHPCRSRTLRQHLNDRIGIDEREAPQPVVAIVAAWICGKCHLFFSDGDLLGEWCSAIRCECGGKLYRIMPTVKPEFCSGCMHHKSLHRDGKKERPCGRCGCRSFWTSSVEGGREMHSYQGPNLGNLMFAGTVR